MPLLCTLEVRHKISYGAIVYRQYSMDPTKSTYKGEICRSIPPLEYKVIWRHCHGLEELQDF
jgi:hypothetical protein